MNLIVFLVLVLPCLGQQQSNSTSSASAANFLNKNSLFEFDNRHFVRQDQDNQLKHGLCWSFAGKRLAEEQLAKENYPRNNQSFNLSPLDFSQSIWRYNKAFEGAPVLSGLNNSIHFGVCENRFSPYPTEIQELEINKKINNYYLAFTQGLDPLITDKDYKKVILDSNITLIIDDTLFKATKNFNQSICYDNFTQTLNNVNEQSPLGLNLKTTMATLRESGKDDVDQALKNSFITSQCIQNRYTTTFKKLSYLHVYLKNKNREEKAKAIYDAIKNENNCLAVTLCAGQYIGRTDCCSHAIVLDSIKFNETENKWKGHFINSWGEDTKLKGWIPMEEVIDHFLEITYYTIKK